MSTRRLAQYDTKLSADTVEWCPDSNNHSVAACGTYQLDSASGRRHGSLSLHRLAHTKNTSSGESGGECVSVVQEKVLEYGILDMKWRVVCGEALLALAASSGDVVVERLPRQDNATREVCCGVEELGKVAVCRGNEKPGICLSLDWNRDTSQQNLIVTSDSLGKVSIIDGGRASFRVLQSWRAHDFEAWIVCFGSESHTVFSGGDDCRLCVWDTRALDGGPLTANREHTMGVCSLQVHPTQYHLLASGSYDERVVLWDMRSLRRPVKETAAGGGVWRVKWHPTNPDLMAVACMHDGVKILDWKLSHSDVAVQAVCEYREHGSLAYGVDWCRAELTPYLLASCSFYDHSLHFWAASL